MSTVSDNDDAPQPNHALVASLLPTIRPPKALETPDGHTKRSTAQLVIGKTLSLCLMAGILGGIYAFGELTSGVGCLPQEIVVFHGEARPVGVRCWILF